MQIVQVIPITKSINSEVLTYFSVKEVALGKLVTVPLRKKEIKAIVVQSESVVNMKTQLRGANYQIRNVIEVHDSHVFSSAFLHTCNILKDFYVTSTGRMLNQVTPSFILKNIEEWHYPSQKKRSSKGFRQLLLQRGYYDRITYYKTMIREHMFQKESLHIICSTIDESKIIFEKLQKNNNNIYLLHSGLTQKKLRETYKEMSDLTSPSFLISTPGFVDTYQHEKSTMVIEQESSEYYRTVSSPYIDMRVFIKKYANSAKITLVWADSILRPETYVLSQNNQGEIIEPLNKKVFKTGDIEIISQHTKVTKKQSDAERISELSEKKAFQALSKEAIEKIKEAILKKEKIFLFVHRKGLAPTIVCNDCGNVARSPESDLPYSLYIKTHPKTRIKERVFICTMTGESLPAFDSCQFCAGYNLNSMGIGTERVREEVQSLFPKTRTHIIDSAHVTTKKGMKEIVADYIKNKSAVIVIGTRKAIAQLPEIDTTVIVSLDSYFSRMSYNTHPEVLNLVVNIKEKTKNPVILQSRNITESSLPILHDGLYTKYIDTELSERKKFSYPPYSTICTLKRVVPKFAIRKEYDFLSSSFHHWNPNIMTHPAQKKTMVTLIMVLQLDADLWSAHSQDAKLASLLYGFDRTTEIKFNPQNLI
jgi:primosomal protein N'